MKVSKFELENAILTIAKNLKCEASMNYLLSSQGLYQTSKEVIFELFVQNKQDYFQSDDEFYNAIQMLREYHKEMKQNGSVTFNNSKIFIKNTK